MKTLKKRGKNKQYSEKPFASPLATFLKPFRAHLLVLLIPNITPSAVLDFFVLAPGP